MHFYNVFSKNGYKYHINMYDIFEGVKNQDM